MPRKEDVVEGEGGELCWLGGANVERALRRRGGGGPLDDGASAGFGTGLVGFVLWHADSRLECGVVTTSDVVGYLGKERG